MPQKGRKERWLRYWSQPIRSGLYTSGRIEHYYDITEYKQMEESIKRSEEMYRTLFETTGTAMAIIEEDTTISLVNSEFERLSGYLREEIEGKKSWTEFVIEDDLDRMLDYHEKRRKGNDIAPRKYEFRFINKTGEIRDIFITVALIPGTKKSISSLIDITDLKRAEKTLRESEEKFRHLSEEISEGITITVNGKNYWVNKAFCNIFGYKREELIGKGVEFLVIPEEVPILLERMKLRLAGKKVLSRYETIAQRKDGKKINIEVSAKPIKFEGKQAIQIVVRDITDRKIAEEAIKRKVNELAALYEASQMFLELTDTDTTLEKICQFAVERFKLKMAWIGLVGEDDFRVIPKSAYGFEDGYLSSILVTYDDSPTGRGPTGTAIRTGKAIAMNQIDTDPNFAPWRGAAQKRGYRSSAALPLCYGDKVLGALTLHSAEVNYFTPERLKVLQSLANLTAVSLQRARLYEQVQQYAIELEHRVAERTADLESFAYSVSHDLRAPLRAMQGFAQALLEDYGDRLDEIGQDYAKRIVSASQHMDILIQDLLTYSRLSRTDIYLHEVSLDRVIEESLYQIEAEIRNKEIEFSIEKDLPRVYGHHATLVQVVANLISNAVKFVPPETKPRVNIWGEEVEESIRLWIEDNGIGIAPEHQERIFRVFERLHGVETYPGTGIGLAIVRKGIERMDGKVGVESEVGKGSRFWIMLPKLTNKKTL